MIANFGICSICTDLIEDRAGMWRDPDGHSFSLDSEGDGFRYHVHTPISEENYTSQKYSHINAEILDNLAMLGYAHESLGDQSTFGFFDFFPDYLMILTSHPDGSVTVTEFEDNATVYRIWGDIERDYLNWEDEDDYDFMYDDNGDDHYAYESGAYESDLWD